MKGMWRPTEHGVASHLWFVTYQMRTFLRCWFPTGGPWPKSGLQCVQWVAMCFDFSRQETPQPPSSTARSSLVLSSHYNILPSTECHMYTLLTAEQSVLYRCLELSDAASWFPAPLQGAQLSCTSKHVAPQCSDSIAVWFELCGNDQGKCGSWGYTGWEPLVLRDWRKCYAVLNISSMLLLTWVLCGCICIVQYIL